MSTNGSYFRITDGKGFNVQFANGWSISVQFGWGNYCDNYSYMEDNDFRVRNRMCGQKGSSNAECAVFAPDGDMVKLPDFMFADPESADIVSSRSDSALVLRLMNWVAEQPK
jgi:hypothetical protein